MNSTVHITQFRQFHLYFYEFIFNLWMYIMSAQIIGEFDDHSFWTPQIHYIFEFAHIYEMYS